MPDLYIGQFLIIPFLTYIWARMNLKSILRKSNVSYSNTLHFKNYKTCREEAKNVEHEEARMDLANAANYYIWSLFFMITSFIGVVLIMIVNA